MALFQPFHGSFTRGVAGPGIVHRIGDDYNGEISRSSSQPRQGTTMLVRLPARVAATAMSRHRPQHRARARPPSFPEFWS